MYFSLLRRTPWRHHAKLVVVTPEGLPLTQPESQLLPPLIRLSVQTLADFSRRLPAGFQPGQQVSEAWVQGSVCLDAAGLWRRRAEACATAHPRMSPPCTLPQLDAAQPRASYEGGEQRCFQDLFICGRNFPLGAGLPPAEEQVLTKQQRAKRLAETVPLEPWTYGQAVAAWHQQAGAAAQRMRRRPRQPAELQDGISLLEAAAAAPAPAAASARSSSGRLRVLVIKRGGEGRQILNAPELLQHCNAWRYQPPGGGPAVTADCTEVGGVMAQAGPAVCCS